MLNKKFMFILITLTLISLSAKSQIFSPLPSERQKKDSSVNFKELVKKDRQSIFLEEATVDTFFNLYSFDEVQDRSQLVQLAVLPYMKFNLLKNLDFKIKGLIGISTGRVQTRFDNPQFSALNLNELVLSYSPFEKLNFEIGALNQNHYNTPMLVLDRAFPGVLLSSEFEFQKSLNTKFKIQYSIPNSVSFETDRIDNEPIPIFSTQGAEVNWDVLSWLKLRGDINLFQYRDLPSIVAFQSGRLGNSVIGVQSSESQFAYSFNGLSQAYQFDLLGSKKIKPRLAVQMIDNFAAPASRRRSQWTGLALDVYLKKIVLGPELAYFYAESDSVPALYSDVRLGRNNREGMSYKLQITFSEYGFTLSATYVQARRVEAHSVQNDLSTFEFFMELPSVVF